MLKRCEICGRLIELPEEKEVEAGGHKSLTICEECRKDRRKSLGKTITQSEHCTQIFRTAVYFRRHG